tara:strand:- start:13790 stop:14065 length:276 start_codon:yes stop_codon:yes gene_type:complete
MGNVSLGIVQPESALYLGGLANAGPAMTKPLHTDHIVSLAASRAPSANNHVDPKRVEDGSDTPSAYPEIPSSEQIVGPDSGMIKPPKRPDD